MYEAWDYATLVIDEKGKKTCICNFCKRVISGGGIIKFTKHLAGIKGWVVACPKVPLEVRFTMQGNLKARSTEEGIRKATSTLHSFFLKVIAKTRITSRSLNHNDDASSSKKMFKTFNNNDVAAWSDVNHDVLFLVMMRLGVIDFVSFSGVCKSWRSFALDNRNQFMASMPPMHMWIEPASNDYTGSIFHLVQNDKRSFKTKFPLCSPRECVGFTCGYLILFGLETPDFFLVNPITRHQLHFPKNPLYVRGVSGERFRGILVFSPSISGWVFVMPYNNRISFIVAGKRRWNHVTSTVPIFDLHVFKGKIYTLHNNYCLGELRLKPNQKPKWTLHEPMILQNPPDMYRPLQLVSIGEDLYVIVVARNWNAEPQKVLKLDFDEMKLMSPGKTIREYVFFFSYFDHVAVGKLESWAGTCRQYHLCDTDKSGQDMLCYIGRWYFPHECSNVNLLDE